MERNLRRVCVEEEDRVAWEATRATEKRYVARRATASNHIEIMGNESGTLPQERCLDAPEEQRR